jgi:hypothetical protein
VIRQTNWWQVGGKKPSLLRYSDGFLPRKLTDGYRLSRLACEAIRCRLGFLIDGDGVNLIYPAGPRSSAAWRARAEGEGEVTRPWTEAETRRLKAWARKKVSAEDVAKSLGRHVGPVKKKARELGLILFKKVKAKPKG